MVFFYVLVFLLVYFIYYYFVIKRKDKIDKFKNSMEMRYLKTRYQVNIDKLEVKKAVKLVAFSNTFIIVATLIIIDFFEHFIVKLGVAFVSIIILQLVVYHIVGKYLQRGGKK